MKKLGTALLIFLTAACADLAEDGTPESNRTYCGDCTDEDGGSGSEDGDEGEHEHDETCDHDGEDDGEDDGGCGDESGCDDDDDDDGDGDDDDDDGGCTAEGGCGEEVASCDVATLDLEPANVDDTDRKVTFCHATSSATNPYVVITTSVNACKAHEDHRKLPKGGFQDVFPTGGCQD